MNTLKLDDLIIKYEFIINKFSKLQEETLYESFIENVLSLNISFSKDELYDLCYNQNNKLYMSDFFYLLKLENINLFDYFLQVIKECKSLKYVELKDEFFDNPLITKIISNLNKTIEININFTNNKSKLKYIDCIKNINNTLSLEFNDIDYLNNIKFKQFIDGYINNNLITSIYYKCKIFDETFNYIIKNIYFKQIHIYNSELIFNSEVINNIKYNKNIESIYIMCNSYFNINIIVEILKYNKNIKSLNLQFNKITSIKSLIDILKSYNNLEYLDLSMNNINKDELKQLKTLNIKTLKL